MRHRLKKNSLKQHSVLVLNATFEPIHIASAQRAITLLVKGAAVMVDEHDDRRIHPGMKMPSVVRLSHYRRIPYISVTPRRENILLRDNNTCQYCGFEFPQRELTLDHVLPRAQGGKSTWENLVAACKSCNNRKDDRTPDQANMPLLNKPRQMTIHTSRGLLRKVGSTDPNWRKYLYH